MRSMQLARSKSEWNRLLKPVSHYPFCMLSLSSPSSSFSLSSQKPDAGRTSFLHFSFVADQFVDRSFAGPRLARRSSWRPSCKSV